MKEEPKVQVRCLESFGGNNFSFETGKVYEILERIAEKYVERGWMRYEGYAPPDKPARETAAVKGSRGRKRMEPAKPS